MELLVQERSMADRWRSRSLIAWILLGATLFGCSIVGRSPSRNDGPSFDHGVHVSHGLTCLFCHKIAPNGAPPLMPEKDLCLVCHANTPVQAEVEGFFENYTLRRAAAPFSSEIQFSHPVHEESIQDCNTCHEGIRTSEQSGPELRVEMDECMACHEALGLPNECSTCHAEIDRDWEPENHAQLWKQRHGQIARARNDRHVENCALCHTEDTCIDCHAQEQPDSHTEFFRMRGHGLTASMDRQNCAACHRSDFCNRCHFETQPMSHFTNPKFGSPRNDHCFSCHYPLRSENCSVCHLGTPSHSLAPPKPSWHSPAMDCRSCHEPGIRLTHADGGQDCNLCHH